MFNRAEARAWRRLSLSTALCAVFAAAPIVAFAATVPDAALDQAAPGRVEQQFQDQALSPKLSPSVQVRDLVLQQVPEGAEKIRFNLNSLTIEGVSVYTHDELQAVYADKLGENISLTELYAISTALTNKYRNDGYILTQVIVPPQTIDGGNARLKVVEGYIDSVSVEGTDDPNALALIERYAAKLQNTTALNATQLERYLLLISDLPGVEARSVLGPSQTQAGAAYLRIIVERDPYDAFISLDNFGSRYLGPVQASAAGSLNSYFGNNEKITGQVVVAPHNHELGYASVGYEQPVGNLGTVVKLTGSHTATEPGYTLDEFNVRGRSQYMAVTLEHPFLRSRSRNAYGYVKFDWRNVESRNDLEPTRRDNIRALRAGGRYEFMDALFGAAVNSMSVELAQGVDILGSSAKGDANLTRPAGDPKFTKISGEAQRLQRITSDLNLLLSAHGQLSANPLLASEEFGVGGVGYGRGFDPSEIIGDDGVAGKVELQWNQPYPWELVDDYQLYSFFDIGRIWNQDATTSSLKSDTASSTGLGVRADFTEDIKAGLALAWPLNRDVETQGDRGKRLYFNVSRDF
ncbi:MAG: ShlB/FhaC/HecB family hemolysin secretion/activation protein [Alphaproteobacteria bacterium]|nr:ShlB/FhaC/HecB family hemolysin secretion/activation protein [Alphaproteobacteria bacterium]